VAVASAVLLYGKMEILATVSNVSSLAVYRMEFLPFRVHISWVITGLVAFVDT